MYWVLPHHWLSKVFFRNTSTYLSSKILTTSSQPCIAEGWTEEVLINVRYGTQKSLTGFLQERTTKCGLNHSNVGVLIYVHLVYARGDLRRSYQQCAVEFCLFCSPSSRCPGRQWADAERPEDRPPCRRCGRHSIRPCFSELGWRRDAIAPGSRRGSSVCRPSSAESWERRTNADTCYIRVTPIQCTAYIMHISIFHIHKQIW